LAERAAGVALPRATVSLVNNRHPDPGHFADIVGDLRRLGLGDAFGASV
jgi:hypothetical protein